MVQEGQQRPADGRPQLQRELALAFGGEAGRDERDVQGAAEGRQRVDGALVVQAEDGEDAAGVLGANWRRKQKIKGLMKRLYPSNAPSLLQSVLHSSS